MARPTLFTHRKFARLAADIGSEAAALGHLEFIWAAAGQSGDDLLGDARDVELAARWRGEPGVLLAALMTAGGAAGAGFIEERGGLYYVHDLFDHAPKFVAKRAEREAARVASGRTISEIRSEAGKLGGRPRKNQAEPSENQMGDGCFPEESKTKAKVSTPSPALARARALAPTEGTLFESSAPSASVPPRERARRVSPELPPIPAELDTPEFRAALAGRLDERAARGVKARPTGPQLLAQFRQLSAVAREHGVAVAVECLEYATAGGYPAVVYKDRLPSLTLADRAALAPPEATADRGPMPSPSDLSADHLDRWESAVASLRLPREDLATWFRPLGVAWNGNGIHVYAPNDRFRASFEEHYSAPLSAALGEEIYVEKW